MLILISNITPKVGALSFSELLATIGRSDDLFPQISVAEHCDLSDSYTRLIYILLTNVVADVYTMEDVSLIENYNSDDELHFGLYYENGRKEHGFRLIIDCDSFGAFNYQSYFAEYFEWDFIKYEPTFSYTDIAAYNSLICSNKN